MLESLATWAQSLTPVVVLQPDEGLLLEVHGSLRYFAGLKAIRRQLQEELDRRGWTGRLAAAPTPLSASWLVRCKSSDVTEASALAGAIGRLPLAATGWPEKVQRMLGQMGLRSIADCLRLPRVGFARRVGLAWLDELDRALGKLPDFRPAWRAPQRLSRLVEFSSETTDQAWFAEALRGMTGSLEQELRQHQVQVSSIRLVFRHIRSSNTLTQISYVEPVHEQARLLSPLLAHIERLQLAEPAIALAVETSVLVPLRTDPPGLLLPAPGDPLQPVAGACSDLALVENLRGRFGTRSVFGIDAVAEHRPEYAWRRRLNELAAKKTGEPDCVRDDRPLWLLPAPKKWVAQKKCQTQKVSDTFFSERVESGWWDGQDIRRDYHVVTGKSGEKLWLFRDRLTGEWYLHGIFG